MLQIIFTFFILHCIVLSAKGILYSPLLEQRGPLYDGIKLLLFDERFHAELVWNETVHHLNEAEGTLHDLIERLDRYNPSEKLLKLNNIYHETKYRKCFKNYERDVAHSNRLLLDEYKMCRKTVGFALETLKTSDDFAFIHNAASEIQNIDKLCEIDSLRRTKSNKINSSGIQMCVISSLSTIDQHLSESSLMCLDIIAETLLVNGTDINVQSCYNFEELQEEFDVIQNEIVICAEKLVI